MGTFLAVLAFMLVLVAAMAIGVLMGRKPISGSCGGMAALGMDVACDICGGDKSICETETEKARQNQAKDLGYDASQKKD